MVLGRALEWSTGPCCSLKTFPRAIAFAIVYCSTLSLIPYSEAVRGADRPERGVRQSAPRRSASSVVENTRENVRIYQVSCSQAPYFDNIVIRATSIYASVTKAEFPNRTGVIGVTAVVKGKGNSAVFTDNVKYTVVGNRLELGIEQISTGATKGEFKEHFGPFPEITCTAR